MCFSTNNIHCNVISGAKDNNKHKDIMYIFLLTDPLGFMIINIPTNILYQIVTK